jgi:O-antigen/teichoic acid export membrane protein
LIAVLEKIFRLRKSKVVKNTSVLLVGQVISRLMQIFYVAALARYVGTAGVGKISTAMALTGLLVFIVGPGLTTLMVRDVAADRQKAPTYLWNTLFIRLVLGILFFIAAYVVGIVLGYPLDLQYIVLIYAVVALFDALGAMFSSVFQAFELMEYDAISQVIRDLINVCLSLLAIYLKLSLLIIVIASAVAQISKFIIMAGITHRKMVPFRPRVDLGTSKALLVRSLPFGALLVLVSIRYQMSTFILSLFSTVDAVGVYSAATTIMTILLMLAGAFSSAILPVFSRMFVYDQKSLSAVYQLSYKYLMLVGFPIGVATVLFGGNVIVLIYGEEFRSAGVALAILAASLLTMMSYSNGPLLNAIGKQRFFAWTQAIVVVANALFCLIFIPFWGTNGAALGTMLSSVAGFSIHSFACHYWLGLKFPWETSVKVLLSTLLMGIACLLAGRLGMPWWAEAITVMPVAYAIPVFLFRLIKQDELRTLAYGPAANGAD